MPEGLKQALWGTVVLLGVSFLAFLFKDILVEKFIVPEVKEQLIAEGDLSDVVKEGRFVSVDTKLERPMRKSVLVSLEADEYLTKEHVKDLSPHDSLTAGFDRLLQITESLQSINNAHIRRNFEVALSHGNLPKQGEVLLNSQNSVITYFVKQGDACRLTADSGKNEMEFRAILGPTPIDSVPTSKAVGQIRIEDWKKLFAGENSTGTALIHIQRAD